MDSLALGQRLGNRYRGMMGPAKLKMGVSGCPRNCSEATIKDFGVVAVEGGWDLYIGGNGGAHVYVAQKIAQVKTDDEVIRVCDRFYEYYRRYGKYGERTALFVERVGLKTVVDAILNAPPQELQELEERFQKTLDNYRDPWMADDELNNEAENPSETDANGFTVLVATSAIPAGASQLFHVGNTPVAVFHGRDGRWVAAHGICPHKSGPLVDSIYGNGRLVCPLHSYSFDVVTGSCDTPEIPPVQIFETVVRDDQLHVRIVPPQHPAFEDYSAKQNDLCLKKSP
jgi:nitrite reductase/ring-hydroxylating ferredoxin subunit